MDKFYRPTKKSVTMRLDSDVIKWLKADGHGSRNQSELASTTNHESSH